MTRGCDFFFLADAAPPMDLRFELSAFLAGVPLTAGVWDSTGAGSPSGFPFASADSVGAVASVGVSAGAASVGNERCQYVTVMWQIFGGA